MNVKLQMQKNNIYNKQKKDPWGGGREEGRSVA